MQSGRKRRGKSRPAAGRAVPVLAARTGSACQGTKLAAWGADARNFLLLPPLSSVKAGLAERGYFLAMGLMLGDVRRWLKFEEDVEDGGERWSKPYVATLSLHSLFELRNCIIKGTVLLDMCANSTEEIAGSTRLPLTQTSPSGKSSLPEIPLLF